jgi:small subunit ribosomal protein S7
MSRRHGAVKRKILADSKYGDLLVAKFINIIMLDGKKSTAESIVYGALEVVKAKLKQDELEAFTKAINSVRPALEVKSRRVGGATYQVPVDVSAHRGQALALRWIVSSVRKRNEKTAVERLSGELMDILSGRGNSVKTKENTHKMAEANRAFAHFRWN